VELTAEKGSSTSFEEFFRSYVAGAEHLPFQTLLPLAGLQLKAVEHTRASLGFAAQRDSGGALVVRSVESGSPAAKAGVLEGDAILKWNGGAPPEPPDRWASGKSPRDILRLHVRRGKQEVALEFPLSQITEVYYEVDEDRHANEKAVRIRDGLLHGTTQP